MPYLQLDVGDNFPVNLKQAVARKMSLTYAG